MDESNADFEREWEKIEYKFIRLTRKKPDLNAILFLIGVQELGKGKKNFSKQEKQDLMHIATCKVLSLSGFYELEGLDQEGWPHWKKVKPLPKFDLLEQENFLKAHIIEYFAQSDIE
jgi:hypothetical protein